MEALTHHSLIPSARTEPQFATNAGQLHARTHAITLSASHKLIFLQNDLLRHRPEVPMTIPGLLLCIRCNEQAFDSLFVAILPGTTRPARKVHLVKRLHYFQSACQSPALTTADHSTLSVFRLECQRMSAKPPGPTPPHKGIILDASTCFAYLSYPASAGRPCSSLRPQTLGVALWPQTT